MSSFLTFASLICISLLILGFPAVLPAVEGNAHHRTAQTIRAVPLDYPTIGAAIDSAAEGDTVLVSPGIYDENISFQGKRIIVASLLLTTLNQAYLDSTIIDGGNRSCVVRFDQEEDRGAVLCGFTIRNGNQNYGGGIDIQDNASPLLRDLIVCNNTAQSIGGGIYCTWNSAPFILRVKVVDNRAVDGGGLTAAHLAMPRIQDCDISRNEASHLGGGILLGHGEGGGYLQNVTITDNRAQYGGGIALDAASEVELREVTITQNQASSSGGGLYCSLSNPRLTRCLFQDNVTTDGSGGGLSLNFDSHPTIDRSRIINNRASAGGGLDCYNGSHPNLYRTVIARNSASFGGGMFVSVYSGLNLINVTLTANQADSAGSSAYLMDSSRVVAVNSILWDLPRGAICFDPDYEPDEIYVDYCDVWGGSEAIESQDNGLVIWGERNIDADPQFSDQAPELFNLTLESPCIDVGTAFLVAGEDTLVNLSPDEWCGEAPDMGAVEFGMSFVKGDRGISPSNLILLSNYPEPFNGATRVKIYGLSVGKFNLNVYNVQGRQVGNFELWNSDPGIRALRWEAGNLPAGSYWLRIEQNEAGGEAKVTLIK
ncbi:MAG: right-handed parallel beta-helix repeat-containing protein [Calditrichota bacterium]